MAALRLQFPSYLALCNIARTVRTNQPRQYRSVQILDVLRLPYSDSAVSDIGSSDSALSSPTFIIHLRNELKAALRAKDTGRLPVIRAVLADVTNASKTAQPISTDKQLKKRMLKRAMACRRAAEEYQKAGRLDLIKSAENEIEILEQYAEQIKVPVTNQVTRK